VAKISDFTRKTDPNSRPFRAEFMEQRRMSLLCRLVLFMLLAGISFAPIPFASPQIGAQEPTQNEIDQPKIARTEHRGPVDLILSRDGKLLLVANERSGSVTLIEVATQRIISEYLCGERPAKIELIGKNECLVSCSYSGDVHWLQFDSKGFTSIHRFEVGFEPIGLAVAASKPKAYVATALGAAVVELDLATRSIGKRIEVGLWPRYLTLSPDGSRLAVGCSGDSRVYVIDATKGEVLYDEPLSGAINIGHMRPSRDGKYAYFPWMVYRTNPINVRNIQLGWVLASRIARVRLDGSATREAISLDVPRLAVADPHGMAISPNENRLVCAASGTHELLVYRLNDLPFVATGGPGDLIDRQLLEDNDLFYRIELGGRPMNVVIADDNRTAYVANFLNDSVQVVDIEAKTILTEIVLGQPKRDELAFRGMEIFYDGRRSLDQWYSCHTCHYNGGTNSKAMDTKNDGSDMTYKTVIPLYDVHETAPWTWHGWQDDLEASVAKSFVESMQGRPISSEDTQAVIEYFKTLRPVPNPNLTKDGKLSESAVRGKLVFESDVAGCSKCHSGPKFTDGQIHDVGLASKDDRYDGYNTPSLLGLTSKVRFMHDGRAKTLESVLKEWHAPEEVTGSGKLSDEQLRDLIEYLKAL
jgi:DNA-binding beta-propeller fold protein YncE/cytochrome c